MLWLVNKMPFSHLSILGSCDQLSSSLEPREFIKKLTRVFDTLRVSTIIHESQCPDLVDLVPEKIKSTNVFPTEMAALSWILRQQECGVTEVE